jgi:amino acid transporter
MKTFSEFSRAETASGLARVLGPWMATAVVVGSVIGSGVFKKPSAVAEHVPSFGWAMLAWVLLGLLAMCGGLALAELMVMYPKAGGNYVYLREAYGRMFGFLWGWIEFFVIRSAAIAALATIFAESLHDVLRYDGVRYALGLARDGPVLDFWPLQGITVVTIIVLALINARGVIWGGGLGLAVTVAKVGSLLIIALLPFALALRTSGDPTGPLHWNYLTAPPSKPIGWVEWGLALIAVQWAYHGWTSLAPVAEEVREPQRNLPLAIIAGIGMIAALYVSANLAYALVIPQSEMATITDTSVAAEFARRLIGPVGGLAISLAIGLSVFGALNGSLMVGPRLLLAMGKDNLAPQALAAVHPVYKTPAVATMVMAAWSVVLVAIGAALTRFRLPDFTLVGTTWDPNLPFGKTLFDVLTDFAVFGGVLFETLGVTSIFVLRWTRPDAERAYRCVGYPWVPMIYVAGYTALLLSYAAPQKRVEAYTALGLAFIGAAVYLIFLRKPAPADRPL